MAAPPPARQDDDVKLLALAGKRLRSRRQVRLVDAPVLLALGLFLLLGHALALPVAARTLDVGRSFSWGLLLGGLLAVAGVWAWARGEAAGAEAAYLCGPREFDRLLLRLEAAMRAAGVAVPAAMGTATDTCGWWDAALPWHRPADREWDLGAHLELVRQRVARPLAAATALGRRRQLLCTVGRVLVLVEAVVLVAATGAFDAWLSRSWRWRLEDFAPGNLFGVLAGLLLTVVVTAARETFGGPRRDELTLQLALEFHATLERERERQCGGTAAGTPTVAGGGGA